MSPLVKIDLSRPTGNFWIDNGLVVLYRLFGEGEFEVGKILEGLLERLVQETGNEGEYVDPETGEIKAYKKRNWVPPSDKFIKSNPVAPKIKIEQTKEYLIGYLEKKFYISQIKNFFQNLQKTGSIKIKEEKKIKVIFKNIQFLPKEFREYLKTKINNKKKTEIYLGPPGKRTLSLNFKEEGICDFCSQEENLIKAKMWNYPFVVEPGKFANFYPGLKRELKICPTCAVAGLAAYLGWLWCAQGKDALHIFCFHGDLADLERLQREVFDPLRLEEKGRNVPLAFYGPYLHETVLGLLLRLFSLVRRNSQEAEKLSPEACKLLARLLGATERPAFRPLLLYVVTGKPGQAFNMQSFKEFSRLAALYRLYEAFLEILPSERPQEILEGVFRQFQKREGRGYNTIWREKIAAAVLDFVDPLPFVEDFLYEGPEKRPLVFKTLEVFEVYLKEVLNMDAQF